MYGILKSLREMSGGDILICGGKVNRYSHIRRSYGWMNKEKTEKIILSIT